MEKLNEFLLQHESSYSGSGNEHVLLMVDEHYYKFDLEAYDNEDWH
jgi:hypothetical protein